jgi:hypothetical protein
MVDRSANIISPDRRVPKNQKYAHIQSTFKSDRTIRDIEILSNQAVARRRTE